MQIPTIRIELEGVKTQVITMFNDHNSELKTAIASEIERQLKPELIEAAITDSVRVCIEQTIEGLPQNYKVKLAIEDMLAEAIVSSIKSNK